MKKNVGGIDRTARTILAASFAATAIWVPSTAGKIVFGAIAVVLALTAATKFCPLYLPLRIDTSRGRGAGLAPTESAVINNK